jgi:hypothetical protein
VLKRRDGGLSISESSSAYLTTFTKRPINVSLMQLILNDRSNNMIHLIKKPAKGYCMQSHPYNFLYYRLPSGWTKAKNSG